MNYQKMYEMWYSGGFSVDLQTFLLKRVNKFPIKNKFQFRIYFNHQNTSIF